jgi:hypothetical protein
LKYNNNLYINIILVNYTFAAAGAHRHVSPARPTTYREGPESGRRDSAQAGERAGITSFRKI